MNLNVSEWKEFFVNKLFHICAGNYYSSDDYEYGITPYVSASATNNGVGQMTNLSPDFEGNQIVTGKVECKAFYQGKPFSATSDANVYTPKFAMSQNVGLFITSIITFNERGKWSYGRQCRVGDSNEIIIKLPVQHNSDGSLLIDNTLKYSDQGYVPDWQFMEDYIKSLHYKPLTTKRVFTGNMKLDVSEWKEFVVGRIFKSQTGDTDITQDLLTNHGLPVVSAGVADTGIIGKTSVKARIFHENTITIDMFGYACARPYQYKMVTHARCFSLSVIDYSLSTNQCLFLSQMMNCSSYKFAYGRMCSWERIKDDTLKLPIQRHPDGSPVIDKEKKYNKNGYIPDWQFMEDYINSLPYSDRI